MAYEIYTSGEVGITPALPEGFTKELVAFVTKDMHGGEYPIPIPEGSAVGTRSYCDWGVVSSPNETVLVPQDPSFLGWTDWLDYLLLWVKTRYPGVHTFSGEVYWDGDDRNDRGRVVVDADGTVEVQDEIDGIYEGSGEAAWHHAVAEYFEHHPPADLGRILSVFTEHDIAVTYAQEFCEACAEGNCELNGEEHSVSVYWDLPQETRDDLVRRARNALMASTMNEAAMDGLYAVVTEKGDLVPAYS